MANVITEKLHTLLTALVHNASQWTADLTQDDAKKILDDLKTDAVADAENAAQEFGTQVEQEVTDLTKATGE